MEIKYPTELIEKLKNLESITKNEYSNGKIANALVYDKWNHRPFFKNVFFTEPESKLLQSIQKTGLSYPKHNKGLEPNDNKFKETLFDTRQISWARIISVYGSHYTSTSLNNITYFDFLISPIAKILQINIKGMMNKFEPNLKNAYLFTLGGDIIQDSIFNYESSWDYRGDILGLQLWNEGNDFSTPLSTIIEKAYHSRELVESDNYKNHPYYIDAISNCSPKGHTILRKLGILGTCYDSIVSGVKLERTSRKFE